MSKQGEFPMQDWQSLSHVRWDCKYHIVFVPKYRKKKLYGKYRNRVGDVLRDLCRQRGVDLLEGHLCLTTSLLIETPKANMSKIMHYIVDVISKGDTY